MKKFIILIIIAAFTTNTYAIEDSFWRTVEGPVKQVTTTIRNKSRDVRLYYNEAPGTMGKIVCWYDSVGRLVEEAHYIGDQIEFGFVRQYESEETYIEYNYDKNGLIPNKYTCVKLDASRHHISSKVYDSGQLVNADSTVYNALGQKVLEYESRFGKADSLIIKCKYEYDSLGRLCKVDDMFYGEGHTYTIKYEKNGNYTEHHSNKDGKTWHKKYTFNNKGQVIKTESDMQRYIYSDYDKYGNWNTLTGSTNTNSPLGWVVIITERVIEYY